MDGSPGRAERALFTKTGLGLAGLGLTLLWAAMGWDLAIATLLAVGLAVGGAVLIKRALPRLVPSSSCAVTLVGLVISAMSRR